MERGIQLIKERDAENGEGNPTKRRGKKRGEKERNKGNN